MAEDLESWFERGVTDGLPVVPPTRERVDRMIAGAARGPDELVALVPPNYGRATVLKLAVNAVMAGCRPEYFPVVLAAVEAACDPAFNLHASRARPTPRRRSSSSTARSDRGSASTARRACSARAFEPTPPSGGRCAWR